MAIAAEKVKAVGGKILEALKKKVGLAPSGNFVFGMRAMVPEKEGSDKEVEKFVKKDLAVSKVLEFLAEAIAEGAADQTTLPIDQSLSMLYKPSFPHKDWLKESIDALDVVNLEAVTSNNGGDIPQGVFPETELVQYAKQSRYACGDAGRFSHLIRNNRDYYYKEQVLNRVYRAEADSTRATKAKAAQDSSPGDIAKNMTAMNYVSSAKTVAANTNEARSGICTTFAWAGAYPLMERMWKRQAKKEKTADALSRIEVVAYPNHIFAIVNREGDALKLNDALPAPETWGDDVIQVDVWLGSLGYPYIYGGTAGVNAEFGFLEPLKSLFDSKKAGWV